MIICEKKENNFDYTQNFIDQFDFEWKIEYT